MSFGHDGRKFRRGEPISSKQKKRAAHAARFFAWRRGHAAPGDGENRIGRRGGSWFHRQAADLGDRIVIAATTSPNS